MARIAANGSTQVPQSKFKWPENIPITGLSGRAGVNPPLRCLSRMLGNSHVRFLEGRGGRQRPRAYSTAARPVAAKGEADYG